MRILRLLFAMLNALLAGGYIQKALTATGTRQLLYLAAAVLFAAFCCSQVNKVMEDEE